VPALLTSPSQRRRRLAGGIAGLALVLSPVVVAAPAEASATRACSAHMTVAHPHHYGTTQVIVTKLGKGAKVTTVAHYKTTSTQKKATATSAGRATLTYRISTATYGRKVPVKVTAVKGSTHWTCSTSFTPAR